MAPKAQSSVIVTGGAGFIGSALVRHLIAETDLLVINFDALTYAAHPATNEALRDHPQYRFEFGDIRRGDRIAEVLHTYRPCGIIHLAAESHVDRSIDAPLEFVETNVTGTVTLLQQVSAYWQALDPVQRTSFRFHHVSTDEVFGALGETGQFTEDSHYAPNSPYSASKAASDHFVRAWHETYDLPIVVSNCSNNYGPYQFPEKLIPLIITKALAGQNLPVYGKGENVRDWLHVADHASALWRIFDSGQIGECYNVGGNNEQRNIDVVRAICASLDELQPDPNGLYDRLITFVTDRPGHDYRYSVSGDKLTRELGWEPQMTFDLGLRRTVEWYLENDDWWRLILGNSYAGERSGLSA